MPAELMQTPVLAFAGMMVAFFVTVAFVSIADATHR
jgi:hypothetical protein